MDHRERKTSSINHISGALRVIFLHDALNAYQNQTPLQSLGQEFETPRARIPSLTLTAVIESVSQKPNNIVND